MPFTEKKDTATPQSSASGNAIDVSKQQYTEAVGKANEWQANATLSRVYRNYDGTLTPEAPPALIYAFGSLAEPAVAFEVRFEKDEVKTEKVAKKPFELSLLPVDTATWNIDPEAALQKAEDGGGKDFRSAHLAGFKVLQQLSKIGRNPLQWYFRYDTGDGTKLRKEIWIDADTGAVAGQKDTTLP